MNFSWETALDYFSRFLKHKQDNGSFPVNGVVGDVKPTKDETLDAALRSLVYIKKNGVNPNTVNIGPTPSLSLETYCPTQVLSYGNQNQCVIFLQQKLQDYGFYKYKCDGVFLEETGKAVKAFQAATGHTTDEIVGPKTWSSLLTYTPPKPGVLQGDEWVLTTLQSKGNVGSEQGLRDLIATLGAYLYYYNQRQDQKTTVLTLKANCADWINDVGLPYYRARGFQCRGVHCQVKCLDGNWYGHYILEYGPQGSKQYRDLAAWAKGKGLTEMICGKGIEGKDFKFLHYEGDYIP